jgi:hypothetical protein
MRNPAFSPRAWLVALVAAPLGLAGCSPTATYGTGQAPEMALVREMTGGLLTGRKKEEPINYQPRAPLVMPASTDQLPPPAEKAAVATADWPVEENQRLAGIEERNKDPRYAGSQAQYRYLKPLADALPDQPVTNSGPAASHREITRMKQQRAEFAKAIAEAKGYGPDGNKRRFLTDPPEVYREPAATAPAEFSDINTKGSASRGFLARLFGRGS